jgi:hypothetical protein
MTAQPDIDPRPPIDPSKVTPAMWKARRGKNIAIALAVAAFCALFYVITIVKMVK